MPQLRQRAVLILLLVLFAAPLLTALYLRLTGWAPDRTGNHGELVQPAVLLEVPADDALAEHWVLVFQPATPCAADCRAALDGLRRLHVALARDARRVKLALAAPVNAGAGGGLPHDVSARPWLAGLERAEAAGLQDNAAYLVDPGGRYVMRYAPGFDSSGLLDDLERLLRYSRVGVQ